MQNAYVALFFCALTLRGYADAADYIAADGCYVTPFSAAD